jgi:ankyrin repeat protein
MEQATTVPLLSSGGTAVTAMVRLLLERGAEVNAKTKDGTTALVTAARRGNTDAVRLLIAQGAETKASGNDAGELIRIAYPTQKIAHTG